MSSVARQTEGPLAVPRLLHHLTLSTVGHLHLKTFIPIMDTGSLTIIIDSGSLMTEVIHGLECIGNNTLLSSVEARYTH